MYRRKVALLLDNCEGAAKWRAVLFEDVCSTFSSYEQLMAHEVPIRSGLLEAFEWPEGVDRFWAYLIDFAKTYSFTMFDEELSRLTKEREELIRVRNECMRRKAAILTQICTKFQTLEQLMANEKPIRTLLAQLSEGEDTLWFELVGVAKAHFES